MFVSRYAVFCHVLFYSFSTFSGSHWPCQAIRICRTFEFDIMRSGRPERRYDAGKAFDSVTEKIFVEIESLVSYTIHLEHHFKFPRLRVAPIRILARLWGEIFFLLAS